VCNNLFTRITSQAAVTSSLPQQRPTPPAAPAETNTVAATTATSPANNNKDIGTAAIQDKHFNPDM
jgi:hypothetical protein